MLNSSTNDFLKLSASMLSRIISSLVILYVFNWCTNLCKWASKEINDTSNQTIPHLLMVAGVVYFKLSTSKTIRTFSGKLNRSPLGRVNILLSSKTLFRFSAHCGSISPSNTIQSFFDNSPRKFSDIFLNTLVNKPSVQSRVTKSSFP